MSKKTVTVHKSRSVGFSWANPIVRQAVNEKPGMFRDYEDGRAVASVLILGALLAGAIVAAIIWVLFIR